MSELLKELLVSLSPKPKPLTLKPLKPEAPNLKNTPDVSDEAWPIGQPAGTGCVCTSTESAAA